MKVLRHYLTISVLFECSNQNNLLPRNSCCKNAFLMFLFSLSPHCFVIHYTATELTFLISLEQKRLRHFEGYPT